jgi:hypothetical protein
MRTFEISYESFGQVNHYPLIENGAEVFVTNENRNLYIERFIDHFANTSIQKQFHAFQVGFYKIAGGKALAICRPSELELLICGMPSKRLDFQHLEEGAGYDDGYSKSHTVIR